MHMCMYPRPWNTHLMHYASLPITINLIIYLYRVGFVPRKHILSTNGVYTYGSFELVALNRVPMYSMILVGAAFFKAEYLQMFATSPVSVHEMIDEAENCDDISFNVMIADYFKKVAVDLHNLKRDADYDVEMLVLK